MAKTKSKTTKKVGKKKKSARPVARKKATSARAGRSKVSTRSTTRKKKSAAKASPKRKQLGLLERATHWVSKLIGVVVVVGGLGWGMVEWTRSTQPELTRVDVEQISEKGTPHAESLPPIDQRVRQWVEWTQSTPKSEVLSDLKAKTQSPQLVIQDKAPLVPDSFNCTTYVETIVALARSSSDDDFVKHLLEVRYRDSVPTYSHRNHFPSVDWIPNNEHAGVLKDVTATLAHASQLPLQFSEKQINRWDWYVSQVKEGSVDRSLASSEGFEQEWAKPVQARVPFLDVGHFAQYERQIPDGAIINIVHFSKPGIPVVISHQGIALRNQQDGALYLKHSSPKGELKSEKLENYLRRASARRNWPAVGININVISSSL